MCQASREAYAREHGLSAKEMTDRVHSRRINATMYAYNARWNKLLQSVPIKVVNPCKEVGPYRDFDDFTEVQEARNRGYPVAVLPDGRVYMDIENCEHRWMCPGPCKNCNNPEGRRV